MRRPPSQRSTVLLLAALTLLGYGFFLSAGFHWDDWGFAWARRFLGPAQFIRSFQGFRPFLGPIFFLTTSLIPPVPLLWQAFALVIRFLIGLSAWWALRSAWPDRPSLALAAALLLLVYPGYSQHGAALTHINQELLPFIFYLLSFGVSVHAARRRRLSLILLALFLQFWGLFPTEYFLGLEPLRLLFLWPVIQDSTSSKRLRRLLLLWLPYLLLWLADAAWLAFLYRSPAYISYGVQAARPSTLAALPAALLDAVLKAGLIAWGQVLPLAGRGLPSPTSLLVFSLIAISFVLVLLYFSRLPSGGSERRMGAWFALAGLGGILLGRLPSLAAGLPLVLQSVFDRFTISMALGVALLMAGLVELLFGSRQRPWRVVISLLVALGVGQQAYNAALFRRDWSRQKEIYWQMAWRIPALQPGTLLLTDVIPDMPLETDLSFTAGVNWLFAPRYSGGDLPYALLYSEARLGGGVLPDLEPGKQVILPFRTVSFRGSTDAVVAFLVPSSGCLRILDPRLGDEATYEKESPDLLAAIPLSDLSRVETEEPAVIPERNPFGIEPHRTWCYFYEQAELSRQRSDWQQVLRLEDQAHTLGYAPEDPMEWLPFIEAHARAGDMQQAQSLSRQVAKSLPRARKGLCAVWERVAGSVPRPTGGASDMLEELGCTP
ncbi:MAG TPA: hypothetical protein VIU39_06480 [Anaerolineales bacterium]